jgi:hypothetical protein
VSFGSGPQPPAGHANCEETRDLLGAFALDSLDPDDEARVRAHLATCSDCRAEAVALRAVALNIGESVAEVDPPPGLRDRILAQARTESPARSSPSQADETVASAGGARRSRWSPWVAAAAAALLALSAGSWGLLEHFTGNTRPGLMASVPLNPLERLLASGDAKVISLSPSSRSGAHGALVTDPTTGTTYLVLESVPPLRSPEVYALWYMVLKNGATTPIRIGQAEHAGAYRVDRGPGGSSGVALTREPETGDGAPKGPVLLAVTLS